MRHKANKSLPWAASCLAYKLPILEFLKPGDIALGVTDVGKVQRGVGRSADSTQPDLPPQARREVEESLTKVDEFACARYPFRYAVRVGLDGSSSQPCTL